MLCGLVSLILVFVMAVPMTVSAAEKVEDVTNDHHLIQALSGGATSIRLVNDITASITIEANQTITLDLNGHTLTNTAGEHTITNKGTLIIKGNGTVDNVSHACAAVYNEPGATLTLNGGKYTRSQENGINKAENGGNSYYNLVNHGNMTINSGVEVTQSGHYSSMIENGWYDGNQNTSKKNAKLTINGGSFSGGLNTIKNDDYGELLITGGTFTNVSQAALVNWNIATIEGGTFDASKADKAAILNGKADNVMDQGILTIKNGSFNSNQNPAIKMMDSNRLFGTIKIENGNFTTADVINGILKTGDSVAISGGQYSVEPDLDYVDADKVVIIFTQGNQTGKYYVGTQNAIQKAVKNVAKGDQIEVVKGNVTLDIPVAGVKISVNDGAKATVNGKDAGEYMVTSEPTAPSKDPSQKPADNAKADKNVATGDDFNMLAAGGAALAAIIAMAAVVITGRRQRQK